MSIHGLQNHRGWINNIINKIKIKYTIPPTDKCGNHSSRPNAFPTAAINGVHDHIKSIPKYRSHYSRVQNPERVYLGSEMNITQLYEHYVQHCFKENIQAVSQNKYRKIFCEEYIMGFKFSAVDTCKTCDSLQIKIENVSEEEKATTHKRITLTSCWVIKFQIAQIF